MLTDEAKKWLKHTPTEWQPLDGDHVSDRLYVTGGWLYRVVVDPFYNNGSTKNTVMSVVFVPDPEAEAYMRELANEPKPGR